MPDTPKILEAKAPAFAPSGLVTLTTDFGQRDGYVGAMKGVMYALARGRAAEAGGPPLVLVDVAHDLPPQDVPHAAHTLATAARWFPAGTVHLAVVDPGVGTHRAEIVAQAGDQLFVAPDNGLAAEAVLALGGLQGAWRIDGHPHLLEQRSATFHGRDVFAPTAAALALGLLAPEACGPRHRIGRLPPRTAERRPGEVHATIVRVDRFGNCVTSATAEDMDTVGPFGEVEALLHEGTVVPLVRTYGDRKPGALIALVGSDGYVEVAVRDGSAADRVGLEPGHGVTLRRVP